MSQPTVKYRGRFSGITKDVYKLLVYEGKKRVGGILLIEGLSPYSRKDINNSPCPDDVKALISRGADPKASMWDVDGAFLDEHLHNKGIGKEMYRRAFAAIAKKKGPIFVHPTYCKLGSGTSTAARRVWKSLRPEYMSSGDVFYLSAAPTKRKNPSLKVPHEKQMFKTREYKQAFQKFYKGRRGAEGSRFTPIEFDAAVLKVGNWRIDDAKGLYGREIDQLCEFDPHSLEPSEVLSQVREGDAGRYAGWMEEGLEPPPIEVVETDKGTLKVVDGHRRLQAAKLLGLPIKAWVSWNAKPYGGGASSGLTYELAKR